MAVPLNPPPEPMVASSAKTLPQGAGLSLAELASTWTGLRTTKSRKAKAERLEALLREALRRDRSAEDLGTAVAWLTGRLNQGRIGVGFAAAYGAATRAEAAAACTLTLPEVEAVFEAVQAMEGEGSQTRRDDALVALLGQCTEVEQAFLVGLLTGELRQGALGGLMEEALAKTMEVPKEQVQRAAMLTGDLRRVALAAAEGGEEALRAFVITPFTPLLPMLAKTAKDPVEVLTLHEEVAFEAKLDGVRIQVHRVGDRVQVYTRSLKEVSRLVPEVVQAALALPCHRVILDGELLALGPEGRPRNFQTVMSRFGRDLDAREQPVLVEEIPLTPFYFDALLIDDQPLLDRPGRERIQALEALVPSDHRVRRLVTSSVEEGQGFIGQVLAQGHEGVIAKDLSASYEAGGRGNAWLKIKPAPTFDLVVLGCDWGSGRRKGWLSNLHLGVRDPDTGRFLMLGKTFKGMTDELLRWQTERFQQIETRRTDWTVYVRPELVVEIAADSVMASTRYPAKMSLRFARVKGYRPDKAPSQASTLDDLRAFLKD